MLKFTTITLLLFSLGHVENLPVKWTSDAITQNDSAVQSSINQGYLLADRQKGEMIAGPLFYLDSLAIQASATLPDLNLRLSGFNGFPVSKEHLDGLRASIVQILKEQGFPFASFTLQPASPIPGSLRPATSLVLELNIQAGFGYKLGGLLARETRTQPEVLLRLSHLQYGENFDEMRLHQGLARLRRLGYFETVDSLGLVRDPNRNIIFPALRIGDAKSNRVGGLLGFDSEAKNEKLSGFVDVHLVNVHGTARDFDFNFESRPQLGGLSDREAKVKYLEPWLPGLSLGLRLSGSILLQDSIYDQLDGAVALLQDLDFRSRLEITFSRQWALDRIMNHESEAIAGGITFLWDARDQVPFTLRGSRLETKISGIQRILGDSSIYLTQSKVHWESFFPCFSRLLLHLRLEGGGDWPRFPLVERGDRFDLGGARSLRGYREREFSTDLYAYSDAELQWLLGGKGRLLLFTSPGLVDKQETTVDWRRVLGYGAGFEIGSSTWVIGLLYALNPARSWGQGLLHITVENRF
jgi:outer membrane protein assembly factor BamA